MIGHIYIIRNDINDKVYIGKTIHTLKERLRQHINSSNNDNDAHRKSHFHNAIRKYGAEHFFISELYKYESDNIEELNKHLYEKEKEFIQKLDSYNNGYNSTLGGEGVGSLYGELNHFYGKTHTDETKKMIGEKSRERNAIKITHTKEAISKRAANRSKRMQKKIYTDKELAQFKAESENKKGKPLSREAIEKGLETKRKRKEEDPNFGKINYDDNLILKYSKSRNPNYIVQLDMDGNYVATYNGLFEIERLFEYDRSSISKCCKGKQKTAYGYKWKYVDEKELELYECSRNSIKRIV